MGHVLCPETVWRLLKVIFPLRLISTLGLDLNPARASIQPLLLCPHLQFSLIFTENIEKELPFTLLALKDCLGTVQQTMLALAGSRTGQAPSRF